MSSTPSAFAYQPITLQRIDLPSTVTSAFQPSFTTDGQHILFFNGSFGNNAMWITGLDGKNAKCLSCGLSNDPQFKFLATAFPDGKRVFYGGDVQPGTSSYAVLECTPSLLDCQSATATPVDFSSAQPVVVLPGGASQTPQANQGASYHAKVSPDGNHIGFSELRADDIEMMVVGGLTKSGSSYVITNGKVINPPGPKSADDKSVYGWSESAALFELKTFSRGGADVTYCEVGGPSILNPDAWKVDLATGERTRLTSGADWEEDNSQSPDGQLMTVFSDKTMNYVDWLGGLLPVRDFINAPASTMSAGALGGSSECMGPMWLLPATGDNGGALAGQPLTTYKYPGVHATDNYQGSSQWSADGKSIVLNLTDDATGASPPFILVAHLTGLTPKAPLPLVNVAPGPWAPAPGDYHPSLGYTGTVTLPGPKGGSVTVVYNGSPGAGALAGNWSETYTNYSENGVDFLNGSVSIMGTAVQGSYSAHLTMTGVNNGSDDADIQQMGSKGFIGSATSTLNGHTVSGPTPVERNGTASGGTASSCPDLLPKLPQLAAQTTSLGNGQYKVLVTASVAGVGANEAYTDTEPVNHATLTLGSTMVTTDGQGVGLVTVASGGSHHLVVTAGDLLVPTAVDLP